MNSINEQKNRFDLSDVDEEEFLIHLKFDHGSYPLYHNVNDIQFLGVNNEHLVVRIGNAYFMGQNDQQKNSSILFDYDKQHENISDTHISRSKIFMKRVVIKEKDTTNGEDLS